MIGHGSRTKLPNRPLLTWTHFQMPSPLFMWRVFFTAASRRVRRGAFAFPASDHVGFGMVARGNCWLLVEGVTEPVALTGGDCFCSLADAVCAQGSSCQSHP